MKQNKNLYWVAGICVLAFTGGCGSPTSTLTSSPQTFVSEMQNAAGCLDLQKVQTAASEAKESRSAVTEIAILEDETPISETFRHVVVRNTSLKVRSARRDLGQSDMRQSGCESMAMGSVDKPFDVKLIQATPTKLVTEKIYWKRLSRRPIAQPCAESQDQS